MSDGTLDDFGPYCMDSESWFVQDSGRVNRFIGCLRLGDRRVGGWSADIRRERHVGGWTALGGDRNRYSSLFGGRVRKGEMEVVEITVLVF